MKRIDIVNGILYYYGNPAGCVSGETAILDTMFQKEELIRFLTEKGIENPVFRGGVYDQLSEDSGIEKTITIDRKESKNSGSINWDRRVLLRCGLSVWQSEGKEGMTDRIEGNMFWFMKRRSKNSIWKKSGRNMDRRFPKTLRDMPWLSRTL